MLGGVWQDTLVCTSSKRSESLSRLTSATRHIACHSFGAVPGLAGRVSPQLLDLSEVVQLMQTFK